MKNSMFNYIVHLVTVNQEENWGTGEKTSNACVQSRQSSIHNKPKWRSRVEQSGNYKFSSYNFYNLSWYGRTNLTNRISSDIYRLFSNFPFSLLENLWMEIL